MLYSPILKENSSPFPRTFVLIGKLPTLVNHHSLPLTSIDGGRFPLGLNNHGFGTLRLHPYATLCLLSMHCISLLHYLITMPICQLHTHKTKDLSLGSFQCCDSRRPAAAAAKRLNKLWASVSPYYAVYFSGEGFGSLSDQWWEFSFNNNMSHMPIFIQRWIQLPAKFQSHKRILYAPRRFVYSLPDREAGAEFAKKLEAQYPRLAITSLSTTDGVVMFCVCVLSCH